MGEFARLGPERSIRRMCPTTCVGIAEAGLSLVNPNAVVQFNRGWITENRGVETFPSGDTTFVVTHGLSVTPQAQDIAVTLSSNPGSDPGAIWVDSIGSAHFTVNLQNSTSGFTFGWQVIVLSNYIYAPTL